MQSGKQRAVRVAVVGACALLATVAGVVPAGPAAAGVDTMRIASKNLTGAEVLSQLYGQALAAEGAQVRFDPGVGPTEIAFEQLRNGAFDAYGEYQGTLLEYLGGTPTSNTERTHAALARRLEPMGLVVSEAAPAVDVNGFYVMRSTARKYKLTTVSDLAKVSRKLVFGGPPECLDRPLCLGRKSEDLYSLRFERIRKLDTGGPETREALLSGDVDVAVLFTGSSDIPRGAVLLRDDRGLQPADNPVLVIRKEAATPDVLRVVDAVSSKVTTAAYRKMSLEVSVLNRDPADVAATFLAANNLP
jgi:osmoprotectant transport system substrate-binding protein